jgi:hypothetical protein
MVHWRGGSDENTQPALMHAQGILHVPSELSIYGTGVPCDKAFSRVIWRRGSRVKKCHQLVCTQHKCGALHPN